MNEGLTTHGHHQHHKPHQNREPKRRQRGGESAAEAVEGAALALERVDEVHGGDGLAAGVFGVGDGVADDVLEEDLEHATGLLVDAPGDALDATPAGQPPDRRLGDALDVVTKDLAVADPKTFSKT
jgi:hypothetical protein